MRSGKEIKNLINYLKENVQQDFPYTSTTKLQIEGLELTISVSTSNIAEEVFTLLSRD